MATLVQPFLSNRRPLAQHAGGGTYVLVPSGEPPRAPDVTLDLERLCEDMRAEGWRCTVNGTAPADSITVLWGFGGSVTFTRAQLLSCELGTPPDPPAALLHDLRKGLAAQGVNCPP